MNQRIDRAAAPLRQQLTVRQYLVAAVYCQAFNPPPD
jgi:hypothetical protein